MAKKRLGMGLGALLQKDPARQNSNKNNHEIKAQASKNNEGLKTSLEESVQRIPIKSITPNKYQPRKTFSEESLKSLSESIKSHGLLQPIVVRSKDNGGWELIAGERRLKACLLAGKKTIPALIKNLPNKNAAEAALVENIQRTDLNPIERAQAYESLVKNFGLTHQEIASTVSLPRSTISNHIRLLECHGSTQALLEKGLISLGHAKVLLQINSEEEQATFAENVVRQSWSVRQLEEKISSTTNIKSKKNTAASPESIHLHSLGNDLGEHLGTKVEIQANKKGRGTLKIHYYNLNQLDGLFEKLNFKAKS